MKKNLIFFILAILTLACENDRKKGVEIKEEAEQVNNEGLIKMQAGNYDEALNLFNKAIDIDSNYEEPHVNKVEIFLNNSEYDKAIKEIDLITTKAPEVAENWVLAGIFEEKKGNQEKAFEHYRTSIEKFEKRIEAEKKTNAETEPENFDSLVGIVFSYILLEDFEQVDAYITLLEEEEDADEQMISFLLDFNKETYIENIFPDFN